MSDLFDIWGSMRNTSYSRALEDLDLIFKREGNFKVQIDKALERISLIFRCEAYTFWVYQLNGDGLIRPLSFKGGSDISNIKLSPGEGIVGEVIDSGEGLIIEDCSKDVHFKKNVDKESGFRTKSMICVPTKYNGVTFGCIQVINRKDDSFFDQTDFEMVQDVSQKFSELLAKYNILESVYGYKFDDIKEESNINKEKNIAVALVNIFGLDELSKAVDNKSLAKAISDIETCISNTASKYNGTVTNMLGNCVEVCFDFKDEDANYEYEALKFSYELATKVDDINIVCDAFDSEINFNVSVNPCTAYITKVGPEERVAPIGKDVVTTYQINNEVKLKKQKGKIFINEKIFDNVRSNHLIHIDKANIRISENSPIILELKEID